MHGSLMLLLIGALIDCVGYGIIDKEIEHDSQSCTGKLNKKEFYFLMLNYITYIFLILF